MMAREGSERSWAIPDEFRNTFCGPQQEVSPCIGTYSNHLDTQLILSSRSRHPGGVQVTLGDGSVRFVGDTIDLEMIVVVKGTWLSETEIEAQWVKPADEDDLEEEEKIEELEEWARASN